MGLFHPERLLYGLAAIVVVLLYLRWRGAAVDVSSHMLWRRALARRVPWRRYQRPVSVVLLCTIVGLLALALAEPYWRSDYEQARNLVLVLDTSAGMKATDVTPDRFTRSRDQARRLVDDLGSYEQMAILTTGGATRVQCGWTSDRTTLRQALDAAEPTDAPSSVGEAIDLARWMLGTRRNPRIVVFSDGNFPGAAIEPEEDVTQVTPWDDAPRQPSNYAITRFSARRGAGTPSAGELLVELGNYSPRETTLPLTITFHGRRAFTKQVLVPAGAVVQQVFPLDELADGTVAARIDVKDDLAADNEAWLSLPPPQPSRIIIPEKLLSNAGQRALAGKEPVAPSKQDPMGEVLVGAVPTKLPPWPLLVIAPTTDCEWWHVAGRAPGSVEIGEDAIVGRHAFDFIDRGGTHIEPSYVRDDTAESLLRRVADELDLANVTMDELSRLDYHWAPDAVLHSTDGRDVLSLWGRGGSPVVVLHVPLDKSDIAARPSFERRLRAALSLLRHDSSRPVVGVTTADVVRLAAADHERPLRGPGGREVLVAAGQTRVGPLPSAGLWTFGESGTDKIALATDKAATVVAVNLCDSHVSDVRIPSYLLEIPLPLSAQQRRDPPGAWLLLAALALAGVEWFLFQRRITV